MQYKTVVVDGVRYVRARALAQEARAIERLAQSLQQISTERIEAELFRIADRLERASDP